MGGSRPLIHPPFDTQTRTRFLGDGKKVVIDSTESVRHIQTLLSAMNRNNIKRGRKRLPSGRDAIYLCHGDDRK